MGWGRLDVSTCNYEQPWTDFRRWRLLVNDGGRHTWHFLKTDNENEEWQQNTVDKYWAGLDIFSLTDGHWPGEYGGPMFLLPGLVIGSYITKMPFKEEERLEMIRYLFNLANKDDGGWGIHIEGHSTVFGTGLNYVALRLLGVDAEHPVCVKARGCTGIPAWGKFWLSLLNVYDWAGNNPVPPELWLLPDWIPFHPHRWWIHTRNVYIPMSYLYGVRFQAEENDLILSLRQTTTSIYWPSQCNNICSADLYAPHSTLFEFIMGILSTYELCAIPPIRRRATQRAYELVVQEDENTAYQTLGPVSKMFNQSYKMHMIKRQDFMWLGPEGLRMTGTNGSQLWDLAFITQALAETGLAEDEENQGDLIKALGMNPKHYNTQEQGYTVTDCTGEGLKAVLYLQGLSFTPKLISERRLCDAVDTMLSLQNSNGGFASYELVRAPHILEALNPAEVFECTTSVITSLAIFRKQYPHYLKGNTLQTAIRYLHAAQKPHGGWVGSWGICFTYAAMFALESLSLVGETYTTSSYSKKACEFLIEKQREDGGWGESYKDGSWAQEAIEGVFNKTCAISYPNFKFSFPIWMLGKADKYIRDRKGSNGHAHKGNGHVA
ncbi:terpenoid cyclases/protein prenyltransferase alpha-alpha toroid [Flagelloscypha sp. PMI_526]|nr:terpenoid cyclases/protein prenyltransferase alpha-alpha toroid [Flagelloscypha sp. PMI_526]